MTLHLGIDVGVQGAIAIVDQSGAAASLIAFLTAIPSVTLDTLSRAASAVGRTLRVELT